MKDKNKAKNMGSGTSRGPGLAKVEIGPVVIPPPGTKKRKPLTRYNEQKQERLPDGSVFQVRYDAVAVMWSGALIIKTETGEEVFESDASGVFKLLSRLDGQYRAWKEGMLWKRKT